jgi:putative transposase
MSEKFQNKYRIPSVRLQYWDYGSNAAYFITICTAERKHFFGDIKNQQMHLSPIGAIADVLWQEIKHHSTNVTLGEFVVMPNHVHGVLIIQQPEQQLQTNTTLSDHETVGQQRLVNNGFKIKGRIRFQLL